MARQITFQEFAKIIDDAYAVDIDDFLSFPYVNETTDEDDELVVESVDIFYADDYNQIENTFYADESVVEITDDGRIKLTANNETYMIKILDFRPLK